MPSFLPQFTHSWKWVGYDSSDIGHSRKTLLLLIFLIENSFLAVTYYVVINLANPEWALASGNAFKSFKILSVLLLIAILGYTVLRWYSTRIGGIYCAKRIALGLVFGIASSKGGIDKNVPLTILLLIGLEVIFLFLRRRYELISDRLVDFANRDQKRNKQEAPHQGRFIGVDQEGKEGTKTEK